MTAPRPGRWAYHGGAIVPLDEATVPLNTQALHYGTGVFEGIRARPAGGRELVLFRAQDHYERLLRSCGVLRIEPRVTAGELIDITADLLGREDEPADWYVRPVAYKRSLRPGTPPGVGLAGISDGLSILITRLGPYRPAAGVRCAISSWRRPGRAEIPVGAKVTGGYVNSALATDEARAAGCDEAIMLNARGEVAEAGTSNVFAVRGGRLTTPPADAGILLGITRDTVLVLAAELGIPAVEEDLAPSDLLTADEVFLTGTGLGIAPVVEIAGRPIGGPESGAVTEALATRYDRVVRGDEPPHTGWITRIGPR
ncbi:aminotransferase class IV [Actinosynnema sp. NPDC023794]